MTAGDRPPSVTSSSNADEALELLAASAVRAAYEQKISRPRQVSRAPAPAPVLSENSFRSDGSKANRSGSNRDQPASLQTSAMASDAEESAKPMHPRDRLLYIVLAWCAIPVAFIAGCSIAWAGGQLSGMWASIGIIAGMVAMGAATLFALEKSPPRSPSPIIVGMAGITWLLVGWQTWLFFQTPPVRIEGFTQEQVDQKISAAIAPIQKQLKDIERERDAAREQAIESVAKANKERDDANQRLENIRQQKSSASAAPSGSVATPSGPINWDNTITSWNTGDALGTVFLGIGITGVSNSLVDLSNAYIVSELTGEKIVLQISTAPGPQLAQLSEINQIPPKVRIELWAKFYPPLHGQDLLTHWGRFRFHAEYSGVIYEHVFDENYVQSFLSAFPGTNVGPHITKKH